MSYYTNLDIDILDEYRTTANVGMIKQIPKNTEFIRNRCK
jgi:hypothetical protein